MMAEKIDLIRRQHIRMRRLEAVADAARAVVAVDGPLDPYDGEWVALADALDALDEKGDG